MYEQEKQLLGKSFRVLKEWKIGRCKMKKGDFLTIVDYGSDAVNNYVVFTNKRIKGYEFTTATWLFLRNTKEAKPE